jgi:LacI family gluconate utilization system Gnt-I transcriptional repressor
MRRSPDPRPKALPKGSSPKSGRASGSVTLDDVAQIAGVSAVTVSRVLNRPDLVRSDTIEHIQRVIERTGYVPNMLAGGLATSRSRVVAAIVTQISHSIFADTIQCMTDRLADAGYQVLLGLSGYPTSREENLVSTLLGRRPEAVFYTGVTRSAEARRRLLAARIPVVETWELTPTPIDMVVGFSHEQVGRAVARYFLGKQYRQIAIVSASDERSKIRGEAFTATLAEIGVRTVANSIVPAPSTLRLGRQGLAQVLATGVTPDAVFCSSDTLAMGVLAEAASRGIAVPGQLAVMGFGDMDFAASTFPSLSTVRIDRLGIGNRAADALLTRLRGETPPARIIDVGFDLVERDSTAGASGP